MVIENKQKPVKCMEKEERGHSRTDLAANQLIELILEQGFQPGDKLPNEYELAALLGIGRSAVREAIRQLVSRNILNVRQGAGTFVAQKTGIPEDPLGLTFIGHDPGLALELSDVRMLIEPAAAELAASNATDEQIGRMVELCEALGQMADQGKSYVAADLELHRYIGECCGNSILRNLMIILSDASKIAIEVSKDRFRGVARVEHEMLVQAIQRRDPVGARYAMISHLNNSRQHFAEATEHPGN